MGGYIVGANGGFQGMTQADIQAMQQSSQDMQDALKRGDVAAWNAAIQNFTTVSKGAPIPPWAQRITPDQVAANANNPGGVGGAAAMQQLKELGITPAADNPVVMQAAQFGYGNQGGGTAAPQTAAAQQYPEGATDFVKSYIDQQRRANAGAGQGPLPPGQQSNALVPSQTLTAPTKAAPKAPGLRPGQTSYGIARPTSKVQQTGSGNPEMPVDPSMPVDPYGGSAAYNQYPSQGYTPPAFNPTPPAGGGGGFTGENGQVLPQYYGYQIGAAGNPSLSFIPDLDTNDPNRLFRNVQNIGYNYGAGNSAQIQNQYGQQQGLYNSYGNAADAAYGQLAQTPGYTDTEAANIVREPGYMASMTTPGQYQSNYMTPQEQAAIMGNTASYGDYFDPQAFNDINQANANMQYANVDRYQGAAGSALNQQAHAYDMAIDPNALRASNNYFDQQSNVLNATANRMGDVESQVGNRLGAVEGTAGSQLSGLQSTMGNRLAGAEGAAGAGLSNAQQTAMGRLSNIEGTAGNALGSLHSNAVGQLGGIGSNYGSALGSAESDAANQMAAAYGTAGNQLGSAATGSAGRLGGIQSRLSSQLGSAYNTADTGIQAALADPGLRTTSEYERQAGMTDAEVDQMANAAARNVGLQASAQQDEIARRAAAAGNTSPLAIAAARDRAAQTGEVSSADAVVNARLAAREAQRGAATGVQQTQLGAAQYRTGAGLNAAQYLGSLGSQNAQFEGSLGSQNSQYQSGLEAANAQYLGSLGSQNAQYTGNLRSQNAGALAGLLSSNTQYGANLGSQQQQYLASLGAQNAQYGGNLASANTQYIANLASQNAQAQGSLGLAATQYQGNLGAQNAQYAGNLGASNASYLGNLAQTGSQNMEQTRLGAEQYLTGQRVGTAGALAGNQLQAAQYGAGLTQAAQNQITANQMQGQQFITDTGTQMRMAQDAANSGRAAGLATNRQGTNQYNQQSGYNQGMGVNSALSGGYQNVANARMGGQQQVRNYYTGQQSQALGAQQTAQGQQLQNYSTMGGILGNNAVGQANYQLQKPSFLTQALAAATGYLSGAAQQKGSQG
jgi:hypothetical protein